MQSSQSTAKSRKVWDKMAGRYDRDMRFFEAKIFAGGREWVCSRAAGRVLEVAVGTGRNLRHYSPEVDLVGIELSPAMLVIARQRASDLGRSVDLREGDAHALPFPDDSFDTVVCVFSLCAISDGQAALAEMRRVLRCGGRLLLLDHVESSRFVIRVLQRVAERITVPLQGERYTLHTPPMVRAAGFDIVESERLKAGVVQRIHAVKPQRF
ncbi:methyltransferase domain-containing protein [Actinoplanes sp. NPDC023936]|uniref:class I SAM-dependent methyltransferase n=1 Tax=Actinoplanes sp. NPDC023936 TaxID=3154910 RepID=UPI0033D9B6E1